MIIGQDKIYKIVAMTFGRLPVTDYHLIVHPKKFYRVQWICP